MGIVVTLSNEEIAVLKGLSDKMIWIEYYCQNVLYIMFWHFF